MDEMDKNTIYPFGPVPHPTTVLIVEDHPALRAQLVELFEQEGYPVAQAKDGQEALTYLLDTETPHVVLLDWQMPKMTGLELLTALSQRLDVAIRHTYLFMTAWHESLAPRLRPFTSSLRIFVLGKPFELDALLALVAQATGDLNH